MSYHHIRLILTSKAVTHNGTWSGEKHFQDIMKYYLKQGWSRCLGRGNSSSVVSQKAARGGIGHSFSLMEIILPVNQKFGARGENHVGSTGDAAWSRGQLTRVWLGRGYRTLINLPSSRELGDLRNDHDPRGPEMEQRFMNVFRATEERPRSWLLFYRHSPPPNTTVVEPVLTWQSSTLVYLKCSWEASKLYTLRVVQKGGKGHPCFGQEESLIFPGINPWDRYHYPGNPRLQILG